MIFVKLIVGFVFFCMLPYILAACGVFIFIGDGSANTGSGSYGGGGGSYDDYNNYNNYNNYNDYTVPPTCVSEWRSLHPDLYNVVTGGCSREEDEQNGW